MITENGTSVRDKRSARGRRVTDDVAVCLRHDHNYARDLRQSLSRAIRYELPPPHAHRLRYISDVSSFSTVSVLSFIVSVLARMDLLCFVFCKKC